MSHPRCHCATPQESRSPGPPTNLSLLGFGAVPSYKSQQV